jgi:hypothetical protein
MEDHKMGENIVFRGAGKSDFPLKYRTLPPHLLLISYVRQELVSLKKILLSG